eukprot:Polyplicarium_translucidae@DN3112_c0_g1_i1.p1
MLKPKAAKQGVAAHGATEASAKPSASRNVVRPTSSSKHREDAAEIGKQHPIPRATVRKPAAVSASRQQGPSVPKTVVKPHVPVFRAPKKEVRTEAQRSNVSSLKQQSASSVRPAKTAQPNTVAGRVGRPSAAPGNKVGILFSNAQKSVSELERLCKSDKPDPTKVEMLAARIEHAIGRARELAGQKPTDSTSPVQAPAASLESKEISRVSDKRGAAESEDAENQEIPPRRGRTYPFVSRKSETAKRSASLLCRSPSRLRRTLSHPLGDITAERAWEREFLLHRLNAGLRASAEEIRPLMASGHPVRVDAPLEEKAINRRRSQSATNFRVTESKKTDRDEAGADSPPGDGTSPSTMPVHARTAQGLGSRTTSTDSVFVAAARGLGAAGLSVVSPTTMKKLAAEMSAVASKLHEDDWMGQARDSCLFSQVASFLVTAATRRKTRTADRYRKDEHMGTILQCAAQVIHAIVASDDVIPCQLTQAVAASFNACEFVHSFRISSDGECSVGDAGILAQYLRVANLALRHPALPKRQPEFEVILTKILRVALKGLRTDGHETWKDVAVECLACGDSEAAVKRSLQPTNETNETEVDMALPNEQLLDDIEKAPEAARRAVVMQWLSASSWSAWPEEKLEEYLCGSVQRQQLDRLLSFAVSDSAPA